MKFIDWFAGVGGFRQGMEQAGHECVGFCEFDKYAVMSYTSMHLITDEQRQYLETLPMKQRQKEILKDEYKNGEWYASDIRGVRAADIPRADCWCFGAPCQDFSVAGHRAGLGGDRSSLVREIFRLLEETGEEDRPEWLLYENVKGMLSSNRGFDYLAILLEMDRGGYDIEWQLLNSKYHGVPQNRERVFTIGHLRSRGRSKVFPIEGTDGENRVHGIGHRKNYRRNTQIFDRGGITETLDTGMGGGRGQHTIEIIKEAKYPSGNQKSDIFSVGGVSRTLSATDYKQPVSIVQELSPLEIRTPQGEDMANTLDTQCNQGIFVKISPNLTVYAVWYPKKQCYVAIRRLTPKECFRLQGVSDEMFSRAEFVNSNSQLYKQAGNGVTVNVIEAIARKLEE